MKNRKITLDRKKVSTLEIAQNKNFEQLMASFKQPPNPFWKSIGFWGTTGMATLAIFFLTKYLVNNSTETNEKAYEKNITLENNLQASIVPEDTKCIQPIIKGNDIPFESVELMPNEDQHILLGDGTTIFIPKGALITSDNSPVTLKTRLFPDKATAFVAGIPMDYEEHAFESAGMIEIRGEQNGKPIAINSDVPIQIELQLFKNLSEGFEFFALDDATGNWQNYPSAFLDENKQPINNELSDISAFIKQEKEAIQQLEQQVAKVNSEIAKINMPQKESYHLPKFEDRLFKLDYNKKDYPALAKLGDVDFEALPNQANFEHIFDKEWSEFELKEKNGDYLVIFSDRKETEQLYVRPIFTGEDFEKAMTAYTNKKQAMLLQQNKLQTDKMSIIEKQKEKQATITRLVADKEAKNKAFLDNYYGPSQKEIKDEQIRNFKKRDVANKIINASSISFTTTTWGVFNCDKPIAYPTSFNVPIDFVCNSNSVDKSAIKSAFVFDLEKDVRYTYSSLSRKIETLGTNKNKSVIIILYENGDLAFTSELNRKEIEASGQITLTPIKAENFSMSTLKRILNENRVTA